MQAIRSTGVFLSITPAFGMTTSASQEALARIGQRDRYRPGIEVEHR